MYVYIYVCKCTYNLENYKVPALNKNKMFLLNLKIFDLFYLVYSNKIRSNLTRLQFLSSSNYT